jgi:hypothetical protein
MPLTMTGPPLGPIFSRMAQRVTARRRSAIAAAAADTAAEIEAAGRNDLQTAGNFGKWSGGFTAKVETGDTSATIAVTIDAPFYWIVHQEGRTISGKPLLWIPLSFAGVPKGTWARDYPGGLFRVDRLSGGAPLLLSIADKQPKYSGHASVTIPKRLHLVEVSEEAAKKFGEHLQTRMSNG